MGRRTHKSNFNHNILHINACREHTNIPRAESNQIMFDENAIIECH